MRHTVFKKVMPKALNHKDFDSATKMNIHSCLFVSYWKVSKTMNLFGEKPQANRLDPLRKQDNLK